MTTAGFRFFVRREGVLRSSLGKLAWPEPEGGKPGAWVKHKGQAELCKSGLHFSPDPYCALQSRRGDIMGRVDVREIVAQDESKGVARKMRVVELFDRRHVVSLAGAAAIMSLHNFETRFPTDQRPRSAVLAVIEWVRTGRAPAAAAAAAADAATAASAADAYDAYADAYAAAYAADAADAYAAAYAADAADAYAAADAAADAADAAAAAAAADAADAAAAAAAAADAAYAADDARKSFRADFNHHALALLALPVKRLADYLDGMSEKKR